MRAALKVMRGIARIDAKRIGIVGPAETNGNREVLAPPSPRED